MCAALMVVRWLGQQCVGCRLVLIVHGHRMGCAPKTDQTCLILLCCVGCGVSQSSHHPLDHCQHACPLLGACIQAEQPGCARYVCVVCGRGRGGGGIDVTASRI